MMSFDPDKSTRGMELVSLQAIFPDEFENVEDPAALQAARMGSRWATAEDSRAFRLRVRPEIQLDMNFAEVEDRPCPLLLLRVSDCAS